MRAAIAAAFVLVWAIPSLVIAFRFADAAGLLAGVAVVTGVAAVAAAGPIGARLAWDPRARRGLRIAFIIRGVVSFVLPCGIVVDMIPGFIGMLVVDAFTPDALAHTGSTTLVVLVASIAHLGVATVFISGCIHMSDAPDADGCCAACGYDLRGSSPGTRCPECGQRFTVRRARSGASVLPPAPRA